MRNLFAFVVTSLLILNPVLAAKEPIEHALSVTAAPLQAYQAMCVDWQMIQWNDGSATISDVNPGGVWRVTHSDGSLEEGIYTTVEPGQRLSYSYILDNTTSQVDVIFMRSSQETEIRIKHSGFGDDSEGAQRRDRVAALWEQRVPQLAMYLNTVPGSYAARPRGAGPFPAVLLLHDQFGLNRSTRVLADSMARSGYYTLAVDMYKGDVTGDMTEAVRFAGIVDNAEALSTAQSAFRALQENPHVIPNRIGVLGLGYGGTMAFMLAAQEPKTRVVVSWYGEPIHDESTLRRISAPVLLVSGDLNVDQPRAELADFSQSLVQAGVRVESLVVQAAPRFADTGYGAEYNAAAATQAWRRSLTFMDLQLRR